MNLKNDSSSFTWINLYRPSFSFPQTWFAVQTRLARYSPFLIQVLTDLPVPLFNNPQETWLDVTQVHTCNASARVSVQKNIWKLSWNLTWKSKKDENWILNVELGGVDSVDATHVPVSLKNCRTSLFLVKAHPMAWSDIHVIFLNRSRNDILPVVRKFARKITGVQSDTFHMRFIFRTWCFPAAVHVELCMCCLLSDLLESSWRCSVWRIRKVINPKSHEKFKKCESACEWKKWPQDVPAWGLVSRLAQRLA